MYAHGIIGALLIGAKIIKRFLQVRLCFWVSCFCHSLYNFAQFLDMNRCNAAKTKCSFEAMPSQGSLWYFSDVNIIEEEVIYLARAY